MNEHICLRCGENKPTHGNLCGKCLVGAFADLLEDMPWPETPEEIDRELRNFGLDPDEVGKRMADAAQKALEETAE